MGASPRRPLTPAGSRQHEGHKSTYREASFPPPTLPPGLSLPASVAAVLHTKHCRPPPDLRSSLFLSASITGLFIWTLDELFNIKETCSFGAYTGLGRSYILLTAAEWHLDLRDNYGIVSCICDGSFGG